MNRNGYLKPYNCVVLVCFTAYQPLRSFNAKSSLKQWRTLRVFHWSLTDNKSSHVSRNLLSILADLNNAVVWIVSNIPFSSKSSSPFTNLITIGITVTFMFNSFFSSLARSSYLSFFLLSFNYYHYYYLKFYISLQKIEFGIE